MGSKFQYTVGDHRIVRWTNLEPQDISGLNLDLPLGLPPEDLAQTTQNGCCSENLSDVWGLSASQRGPQNKEKTLPFLHSYIPGWRALALVNLRVIHWLWQKNDWRQKPWSWKQRQADHIMSTSRRCGQTPAAGQHLLQQISIPD